MPMELAEQGRLARALKNQPRFLRISYFVTPFFADESKHLLSPVNPAWLHVLQHPDGMPVPPGDIEALLPAAMPVRILKVEFPTALAIKERLPYSPRTRPWVYVAIQNASKPLILVLPNTLKNTEEFEAELNRYLTPLNPSTQIAEFSVDEQTAIRSKEALPGISAEALEMALGYPESKTIAFEGEQKIETWHWGGGQKTVSLRGGRVAR
ncbi:MAG: hypothetical protein FWG75_01065 [Cystobacterineae bacterium]|nr:hypothetical protein [Cystobacterineae bacterium]